MFLEDSKVSFRTQQISHAQRRHTHLKFNIAPEKLGLPKRKFIFQPLFFRGYVKLRGSKLDFHFISWGSSVVLDYSQVDVEGSTIRVPSFFFVCGSWSWLVRCCPAFCGLSYSQGGVQNIQWANWQLSMRTNRICCDFQPFSILSEGFFNRHDHARFLMDSLKRKNRCTCENCFWKRNLFELSIADSLWLVSAKRCFRPLKDFSSFELVKFDSISNQNIL